MLSWWQSAPRVKIYYVLNCFFTNTKQVQIELEQKNIVVLALVDCVLMFIKVTIDQIKLNNTPC